MIFDILDNTKDSSESSRMKQIKRQNNETEERAK